MLGSEKSLSLRFKAAKRAKSSVKKSRPLAGSHHEKFAADIG
jgi:hypothetical protein